MSALVKPIAQSVCHHEPFRSVFCWRVPGNQAAGGVALTFDDGPHPEYTARVLDKLASASVKATFFVLGSLVEKYPALFQRIIDDGHEFGIHGFVHNTDNLPRQVRRTLDIVHDFGVTSSLYRPPNGKVGLQSFMWLIRHGFSTVLWSYDCYDSMRNEGKVASRLPAEIITSGDIVLLHDDNPLCLDDLDEILPALNQRKLRPRRLSRLMLGTPARQLWVGSSDEPVVISSALNR